MVDEHMDTLSAPTKLPQTALAKSGGVVSSELSVESPVAFAMVEIGQIVAERGRPPNNIQNFTEARGETPLIKMLESQDAQGNQTYVQVELGVAKDGKFVEGFKSEWQVTSGEQVVAAGVAKIPSGITAEIRKPASPEEQKEHKLHHTNMHVTFHKDGGIFTRIDSKVYPDVTKISGMTQDASEKDIYQFRGQVTGMPNELEHLVLPILTTIHQELVSQPTSTVLVK